MARDNRFSLVATTLIAIPVAILAHAPARAMAPPVQHAVAHAAADAAAVPNQVRQVAGNSRTSNSGDTSGALSGVFKGGLLGNLFGKRSDAPAETRSNAARQSTPPPEQEPVNWDGIPYHEAKRSKSGSGGTEPVPTPIQDPDRARPTRIIRGGAARTVDATASSNPSASSSSSPRVPTRPTPQPRVSLPTPAPSRSTSEPAGLQPPRVRRTEVKPLSAASSSRRPGRQTVETLADSVSSASDLAVDSPAVRGVTEPEPGTALSQLRPPATAVPKVARRPAGSTPAASSRRSEPQPTVTADVSSRRNPNGTTIRTPVQTPTATAQADAPIAPPTSNQIARQPTAPAQRASKFANANSVPSGDVTAHRPPRYASRPMPGISGGFAPLIPSDESESTLEEDLQPWQAESADGSDLRYPENQAVNDRYSNQPRPAATLVSPAPGADHFNASPAADHRAGYTNPFEPRSVSIQNIDHGPDGPLPADDRFATAPPQPAPPTRSPAAAPPSNYRAPNATSQPPVPTQFDRPDPIRSMRTDELAVTSELPGLRVITHGPREIMIRRSHQYEIRIENRGSIDAEGLLVRTMIPDWANVEGHNVSGGQLQTSGKPSGELLEWTVDRLAAGTVARMFIRIRAERSGTFDLDVDWTLTPRKSVTQVRVQEPQLQLSIGGPDEVVYGQSQTYQVRVLNPGDGVAPNVVFTLSPNSSTPQSQRIGDIPAGKEAQFEVELTAQDLGDLRIDGLATGDLELRAEATKQIRVAAAKLDAMLAGPELKYQDTEAVYRLEVQNTGTATSENVEAVLKLPAGVSYLSGIAGAVQRSNQLRWTIDSLAPSEKQDYEFRCRMNSTGEQQFAFDCRGSAAGQADVAIVTSVKAIADLVLAVSDPAAPAPVGSAVTYEIVIRNRGSKAASDVQVIAQFSHGIEPQRLDGHPGKLMTGQALFDSIPRIDAGQEVRLTVVAIAESAGNHRFRTEIRSADTTLVAEEATRYMSAESDRVSRRSSDSESR